MSNPVLSDSPSDNAVLTLQEVRVKLGGVSIVDGVTLTLKAGTLALLTGPNGAGKSTLLRACVNLLPSYGDIAVCGHHPASIAARARFVFVPDEPALYEDLTLTEHTHFVSLLYAQAEAKARMQAQLARFRLEGRLGEFPGTHSRGMRQKLALSLALGLDTPLLLLDEPYNGLDSEAQTLLSEALKQRAAAGGVVLLSGHQAELPTALGARVLRLEDGQLQDGRLQASRSQAGQTQRGQPQAGQPQKVGPKRARRE